VISKTTSNQQPVISNQIQLVDGEKTRVVAVRLAAIYGPRAWRGPRDPLAELILTILSQNTSDTNSGRAFRALKQRYASWQQVLDAPTDELYETIKSAGLGNIKAPRIQATLRAIYERRGAFSLNFLDDMPMDEAREWLLSLNGIGPKTAACVLLFALNKPALPVDTHVHRVSKRLGLIGPRVNADKAHVLLEQVLPPDDVYPFHINMIQHGRLVCHAQRPACLKCGLRDCCAYFQAQREHEGSGS
jgi:endonuclease III